jgi:Histone methylation protein DOT1
MPAAGPFGADRAPSASLPARVSNNGPTSSSLKTSLAESGKRERGLFAMPMQLLGQKTIAELLLQPFTTKKIASADEHSTGSEAAETTTTMRRRFSPRFEKPAAIEAETFQQRKSPRRPKSPEIIDLTNEQEGRRTLMRQAAATRSINQHINGTRSNVASRTSTTATTATTPTQRSLCLSPAQQRCRTRSQARRTLKHMDEADFETLWIRAEQALGSSIEELEQHSSFRSANTVMKSIDSEFQRTAQYGRVEAKACCSVLQHLELVASDTFLDIGHGIGNIVLMAAYMFQCHSRGVEVVRDRHHVAVKFQRAMEAARLNLERERNVAFDAVGSIIMKPGRLEDPTNFDFLTRPFGVGDSSSDDDPQPGRRMKVFCNNFGAVFSDKSAKASHKYFLDDYIAGLFAVMPVGSIIITFGRLTFPATRSQIIKQRQNAEDTGFYELEEINLGPAKDAVSWASGSNDRDLIAYKYTRVGPSSYICPKCGETQSAAKELPTGEMVQNYCKCPDNVSCLRQRPKKKQRTSL